MRVTCPGLHTVGSAPVFLFSEIMAVELHRVICTSRSLSPLPIQKMSSLLIPTLFVMHVHHSLLPRLLLCTLTLHFFRLLKLCSGGWCFYVSEDFMSRWKGVGCLVIFKELKHNPMDSHYYYEVQLHPFIPSSLSLPGPHFTFIQFLKPIPIPLAGLGRYPKTFLTAMTSTKGCGYSEADLL